MADMAVHSAVGNESEKMHRCTLLDRTAKNPSQRFIFEELPDFNGPVDPGEILVDDATGADIEMPHLGVAHLPLRQSYRAIVGNQGGGGLSCLPTVHVGRSGKMDRVALPRLPNPPAIENGQQYRRDLLHHFSCAIKLIQEA